MIGDCRKRTHIFSYVPRTKFHETLQLRCHHLVYLQLPLVGKLVSQKLHVGSLRRHGNKNVKNMTGLSGSVAIKSFCGSFILSHFVQSPFEKIAD